MVVEVGLFVWVGRRRESEVEEGEGLKIAGREKKEEEVVVGLWGEKVVTASSTERMGTLESQDGAYFAACDQSG